MPRYQQFTPLRKCDWKNWKDVKHDIPNGKDFEDLEARIHGEAKQTTG
jgi:hypothetical protein